LATGDKFVASPKDHAWTLRGYIDAVENGGKFMPPVGRHVECTDQRRRLRRRTPLRRPDRDTLRDAQQPAIGQRGLFAQAGIGGNSVNDLGFRLLNQT
jgi:hypothetical protein